MAAPHLLLIGLVGAALAALVRPPDLPPARQARWPGDRCEPNDTLVQPCAIAVGETGGLDFDDDVRDVFAVQLAGGRVYTIAVQSDPGIEPALSLFAPGPDGPRLLSHDGGAAADGRAELRVSPAADDWYLVQVDDLAPAGAPGARYRLDVREDSPAAVPAAPTAAPAASGDALENNYSPETASRVAWGVPYDLSLVCPEQRSGACPGGDHDMLLAQVKRGVPFVALTYDLGPGADTALALYAPAAGAVDPSTHMEGWRLLQGNDDVEPGRALRSQVLLTPTWDGQILVVVAPSDRGLPPRLPDSAGAPARYRLIVGSPLLPAVQEVLRAQATAPPAEEAAPAAPPPSPAASEPPSAEPAPEPSARPAPADEEEIVREACVTGLALVTNPAGAQLASAAPAGPGRYLAEYPPGTKVELLGSCYVGWVKARPLSSVSPGWMFAPDLALVATAEATPSELTPEPSPGALPGLDGAWPPEDPAPVGQPAEPTAAPADSTPTPAPRQAYAVSVLVTDDAARPLDGLRVRLVDVLGRVLREGLLDERGSIELMADSPPRTAVWLEIPAAGVTLLVDRTSPAIRVVVPRPPEERTR